MKIFRFIRQIFKLFLLIFFTIISELFVLILLLFFGPFGYRRKAGAFVATVWSWFATKSMGIKIKVIGKRQKQKEGVLFISNHASYTDIIIISSNFNVNFVSKAEVRKWPVIGFLSYCGGTIYVDRSRSSNAKKYVMQIQNSIKKGSNILIFPEGTSSTGETVLPFYSSLFQAPLDLEIKIQPVYIDYYKFDNKKVRDNPKLREKTAWIGDMSLVPHALDILRASSVEVRVYIGEIIDTKDFEKSSSGRKDLTQKAYQVISELKNKADNEK